MDVAEENAPPPAAEMEGTAPPADDAQEGGTDGPASSIGDMKAEPEGGGGDAAAAAAAASNNNNNVPVGGGFAMRPIFLGNLSHGCMASDIGEMFERPVVPVSGPDGGDPNRPIAVERVDLKRGFCFVFLRDATSQDDKGRVEQFVSEINGMNIDKVSKALRCEFARGDGRIKRKEDERRKKIQPSETLFVVNFHEETTKREDLQMLFEPFGELIRIDMKKNYAFVQFRTVDEAKRAKEATNGGKLDQSEITVEFVARRMGDADRRRERERGGYRGGGGGRGPPDYGRGRDYRGRDDRHDDFRGGGRRDDRYDDRDGGFRGRDRDYRGRDDRVGGYGRGRSRSRSRSPGYRRRSRSPEPRGRDYDDYRGGRGGGGYERRRSRSPEPRGRDYDDRGRDDYRADRGYRS